MLRFLWGLLQNLSIITGYLNSWYTCVNNWYMFVCVLHMLTHVCHFIHTGNLGKKWETLQRYGWYESPPCSFFLCVHANHSFQPVLTFETCVYSRKNLVHGYYICQHVLTFVISLYYLCLFAHAYTCCQCVLPLFVRVCLSIFLFLIIVLDILLALCYFISLIPIYVKQQNTYNNST